MRAQLTHLTEGTASRHFLVVSKGHYVARGCTGWWAEPPPGSLFARVHRVAYSVPIPERGGIFAGDDRAYPHLHSVPYPSAVHLSAAASAALGAGASRTPVRRGLRPGPLMLFTGSSRHGDLGVRGRIAKQ